MSLSNMQWIFGGIFILIFQFAIAALSKKFTYGLNHFEKPILLYTGLALIMGLFYLMVVKGIVKGFSVGNDYLKTVKGSQQLKEIDSKRLYQFFRFSSHQWLLIWIILIGMVMRISMIISTPILEDDFYRYLWDGALTWNCMNPYAYVPEEVINNANHIPLVIDNLANESGEVINRINHPHLRSIYPPVAQSVFALAYMIKPWSIFALRIVYLLFDLAALILLLKILKKLEYSYHFVSIYWWNPILVKEVYNSCHMDIILMPLLFWMILLFIYRKYLWAVVSIVLAVGVKIWPILLLPFVIRPILSDTKRFLFAFVLFGIIISVMFFPIYISDFGKTSGFTAYSHHWEMNDALFMILLWLAKFLLKIFLFHSDYSQILARLFVVIISFAMVVLMNRTATAGANEFCKKCLFIIAALFFLSPTQFPWYYLWMLPFITMYPRCSLLLLSLTLPLYYLRFYFYTHGNVQIFDNQIVWIEYLPVWFYIVWEWVRYNRKKVAIFSSKAVK